MIAGIASRAPVMVHPSQQRQPYPRRRSGLRVTIAGHSRTRSFTLRPWIAGFACVVLALGAAGVISAAGFLIYRDDLIGTAISRQVEMQYEYEERIAALRSELDRVTSRHIVQTESVEQQLATLLGRQSVIEHRQSTLDGLVDLARSTGVPVEVAGARLPRARPDAEAEATAAAPADVAVVGYMPVEPEADAAFADTLLRPGASEGRPASRHATLARVQSSLDGAQLRQEQALDALSATVADEAERLTEALAPIGVDAPEIEAAGPQGGPFVPAAGEHFVERAAMLERMLGVVRALRQSAAALPLGSPLSELRISSRFGNRVDPFLNRQAFHAGLDFVATEGTEVLAAAPGIVTVAGRADGYGNLVEIRHEGGARTRYGHLSAVLVSRGAEVRAGTPIGRVGSTGRSTGPHLHYETRLDGSPVDPMTFLSAGRALRGQ